MKVVDIKNLPKEFNFKSNINHYGILYHAKETEHGYIVTCDCSDCKWNFSKQEIRRKLFNNDYVITT